MKNTLIQFLLIVAIGIIFFTIMEAFKIKLNSLFIIILFGIIGILIGIIFKKK